MREDEDDEESVLALGAALRDGRLAALLAPVLLLQVVGSWIEAVLPLAANNAGTITPSGVGWLFTYAGVSTVCCQLPILRASGRLTAAPLMLVGGGLTALAFGGLLASMALPYLVAAVTLLACAQMLVDPVTQALVNALAPANARATYMAAISVTNDLKDAAGPAVSTFLYAAATTLPWLVGLPVALAASATLSWVIRQHEATNRTVPHSEA